MLLILVLTVGGALWLMDAAVTAPLLEWDEDLERYVREDSPYSSLLDFLEKRFLDKLKGD